MAFPAAVGLPEPALSGFFALCCTEHRARLLLRPEAPVPFCAICFAPPVAVDGFRLLHSSHGLQKDWGREVSLLAQAQHSRCLEVVVDFVHRGDHGQNSPMKFSKCIMRRSGLPRRLMVVLYRTFREERSHLRRHFDCLGKFPSYHDLLKFSQKTEYSA